MDSYKLVFVFKKGFKDGFPSDKEALTGKRIFAMVMKFNHCWKHVAFASKGNREWMKASFLRMEGHL